MRLPSSIEPREFEHDLQPGFERWREAVAEIARAHRLADIMIAPFPEGANLVASLGTDHVVKIFPPFQRHQWESERRALRHLAGKARLAIPALVAEGERDDGWPYVVLSRLAGESLERVWPTLDADEKATAMETIGATMAEVHAIPSAGLAIEPEWAAFLAAQRARARERHLRLGMPAWLVDEAEAYTRDLAVAPARVLLTGEYTPFNLLVTSRRLSGMIDFGDAMLGDGEYDLLGPSVFLGEGDPRLIAALFRGYGARWPDPALRRRLMQLQLLHRYAHFDLQLRIAGWRERARSLDELALLIWPDPVD